MAKSSRSPWRDVSGLGIGDNLPLSFFVRLVYYDKRRTRSGGLYGLSMKTAQLSRLIGGIFTVPERFYPSRSSVPLFPVTLELLFTSLPRQ